METKECPKCRGAGIKYIYDERVEGKFSIEACPKCQGKGFLSVNNERLVKI